MKVTLLDIEGQYPTPMVEEAMDLLKETIEYDLNEPEAGYYHCVSKNPDFHVEMTLKSNGFATAKCHCTVFKKAKVCKHALGALMLLRDQSLRNRRKKSKSKHENLLLEEVLKKINVTELRSFISGFAHSHSGFRAEVLANYLHLIRKPDYHHLLMDMTPIDKYGLIKLNRNNLKTVRNILSTLLKQAEMLLREKALSETFQILDATLHHLYRLNIKLPQFRDQLSTELRHALRLFDVLCHQPMAPRLQQSAILLAMEISNREGFFILKGAKTLLLSVEKFILEKKSRNAAFQLVEHKAAADIVQRVLWGCMVMRWTRLWEMKSTKKELKKVLPQILPDIIQEFSRLGESEDVIYCIQSIKPETYPGSISKAMLQTGLRAAQQMGNKGLSIKWAYALSITFLDQESWETLHQLDASSAFKALDLIDDYNPAGTSTEADPFLISAFHETGQKEKLLTRLKSIDDLPLLMKFDSALIKSHPDALADLYFQKIHSIHDAYGGIQARKKLTAVTYHLKTIDLHSIVAEKLKHLEKKDKSKATTESMEIRGFIFDLDGVIVDTAVHHFHSWKKILKELGATITEEDDQHTRGASRMESLEYLLNRYNISLSEEEKKMWAERKNEVYLEAIEEITPRDLLPGALAFLIDTRKAGLLIALGSASKNARNVLKRLAIEDRFDAILDGHSAKESKPNPEIFTKGCEALGLDPAEVVVFEDAAKGVQAGIAAGCKVVGIGQPDILHEANIVITGLDQSTPTTIIEQLS